MYVSAFLEYSKSVHEKKKKKKMQNLYFLSWREHYFLDACKIFQGDLSHCVKSYLEIFKSILGIETHYFGFSSFVNKKGH